MLNIHVDPERNQVILHSDRGYTAVLNWTAALELGSQLQHAAIQVEPPAPAGKRYEPACER